MADADRFLLTAEQSRRRFLSRIVSRELQTSQLPSTQLRAAITGGQPGAGKSQLIESLLDTDPSAVAISGDDLRSYHPEYRRLQRDDPSNAAFYTDRDAGRWAEMLIEEASNRGHDLIIESTMRVADTFRKTSKLLRAKNYAVEAHVVAVRPSVSWLGVHLRFERSIARAGRGRFTTRASHDAAVAGLPATLAAIQDERLASQISIWERGAAAPAYATTLSDGLWSHATKPDDWLRQLWSRPPSVDDLSDLQRGWALVIEMMRLRHAPASEIAALQTEVDTEPKR